MAEKKDNLNKLATLATGLAALGLLLRSVGSLLQLLAALLIKLRPGGGREEPK